MRQRYLKILGDKLEDSIARMGAILALGIVNAGMEREREREREKYDTEFAIFFLQVVAMSLFLFSQEQGILTCAQWWVYW